MKLHVSNLKHPKGVIKLPEMLFGIACLVLLHYGHLNRVDDASLAFLTYGSYLIITPCILLVNLAVYDEEQIPYLEAVLNLIATALYLTISAILLEVADWIDRDSSSKATVALEVFSFLNTIAYAIDTYITIKVIHDSKKEKPIDILQKF